MSGSNHNEFHSQRVRVVKETDLNNPIQLSVGFARVGSNPAVDVLFFLFFS